MRLEGERILVTGATGQVGEPVAKALAGSNDVWAAARFSDPASRQRLESAGVRCVIADLAEGDLSALPRDFAYVLNFAVAKTNDFGNDLRVNGEAAGLLMGHFRSARAFLHCSSTAVYHPNGHHAFREDDPLGDNHRVFLPTYSISKIAAEVVVRTAARQWELPTTIARLNVPYGDHGGWPALHLDWMLAGTPIVVHSDAPSVYNPIHEDDIVSTLPGLLEAAAVPATTVNWAGHEQVSIEEWCEFMGGLVGVEPELLVTDQTLESVIIDTTRMEELVGPTRVHWRDGMRQMVQARHPELTLAS